MVPTREELSRYLAPIRQCAPFAYCGLTPERLVVEVADPLKLTRCEIDALAARLVRYLSYPIGVSAPQHSFLRSALR